MANEANQEQATQRNYTSYNIADAVAVEVGSLMEQVAGSRVCGLSSGANPFAGVSKVQKGLSDGVLQISLDEPGSGAIYTMKSNAAIAVGEIVALSAVANKVTPITEAQMITGHRVGKALNATTGADEDVEVEL